MLISSIFFILFFFSIFRQISGEINSPLIKVLKAFQGTIKSSVTSAEEGILPLSPLVEEEDNEVSPLQLMMKLKTSMMRY